MKVNTKVLAIEVSNIDGGVYFAVKAEGNLEDVKEMLSQAIVQIENHPLNQF